MDKNLKTPKVSVLMTVFNAEEFLKESVDSILNQSFSDFEFIIVDDASKDRSLDILKNYKDKRIKLLKNKENLGITKSLNIGLIECSGEYIARMDADDIAFPERLQKQVEYLDKNKDIVLLGSGVIVIDEQSNKGDLHPFPSKEEIYYETVFKNSIPHPTAIFRRKEVVNMGGYDEDFKYAQDYELWSRIFKKFKVGKTNEPLIYYRVSNLSISGNHASDQRELALKTASNNIRYYLGREIDLKYIYVYRGAYELAQLKNYQDVKKCLEILRELNEKIKSIRNPNLDKKMVSKYGNAKLNIIINYYKSKLSKKDKLKIMLEFKKLNIFK